MRRLKRVISYSYNMLHINFWTESDDKFNGAAVLTDNNGNILFNKNGQPKRRICQNILDLMIRVALPLDNAFLQNYDPLKGTLNVENFGRAVNVLDIKEDVKMLSHEQLEIIKRYYTIGESNLRDAFEYFGQGSLYDSAHDFIRMYERPSTGEIVPYRVHMADGFGIYGSWHAFN
jgi:hypothetical protein